MTAQDLVFTARGLVADDKGLLAMDESTPTCNRRFAALGIPQTEEVRRTYRELIVTTPRLGECVRGVILYDETIRQRKKDGTPFVKAIADAGITTGIKVDTGAKDMAGHLGEKIAEGLGSRERLEEYSRMGARFAKWRAVIALGAGVPSRGCIEAKAQALARYAALCQEAGPVPVVEPEVLVGMIIVAYSTTEVNWRLSVSDNGSGELEGLSRRDRFRFGHHPRRGTCQSTRWSPSELYDLARGDSVDHS